jgi:hypothetical protein
MRNRRAFSAEFKARVALEVLCRAIFRNVHHFRVQLIGVRT